MITDDELSQLPEDPELAFVKFERTLRERLYEAEEKASREEYGNTNSHRLEYMNKVLAGAKQFGIDALAEWRLPSPTETNIFSVCARFQLDVDHITMQVRIQNAQRSPQNSVGLGENTKTKIRHYIELIKTEIGKADLPDDKRDSLYAKLHRFALEVDKIRTDLAAVTAVFIAVCDGIGQGFRKLEPARRWLDSIGALMGREKEKEDSLRVTLPSPAERMRLEAPRRQIPGPRQLGSDLDDEIPF